MSAVLALIGTKFSQVLGSLLLGSMIATGSGNQTAVNGGAILALDFNTAGSAVRTTRVPLFEPFIAYVKANTGSTTKAYPAACFRNPLRGMSRGSGTLVRLTYHNGRNPTGVGGDITFVKGGCGDEYGSGHTLLINDTCTASGCVSRYTTGTADWNDADWIKYTPRAALAPGFTARITGWVEDNWGE